MVIYFANIAKKVYNIAIIFILLPLNLYNVHEYINWSN